MATFKDAQANAAKQTEKEMAKQWEEILKEYDRVNKAINIDLALFYGNIPEFTDKEKKAGKQYTWALQRDRLKKLEAKVKQDYNKTYVAIGALLLLNSQIAITNNYYREQYIVQLVAPELKFRAINKDIVKASTTGLPKYWLEIRKAAVEKIWGSASNYYPQAGSLTDLLIRNKTAELQKINSAIEVGLRTGTGLRETGRKIQAIIGDEAVKAGLQTYSGARAGAAKIARTEGLRNITSGFMAEIQQASAQGLDVQKMWLATLDDRTRHSHANTDGQIRNKDQNFNVNGSEGQAPRLTGVAKEDINCRCDAIILVDGVEPTQRTAKNADGKSEIINFTKMPDWMKENGLKYNKSGMIV
ncbi:MAG: hypothetical protein JRJ00_00140 [Deltaproteobacteria bacterium]|nr:hypothetical protein [Deltaproteobacteria bacterium]